MLLLPSMELNHGQCVHCHRDPNLEEDVVVNDDPIFLTKQFVSDGAKRIHVVDVEALLSGEPENVDAVRKLRNNFPDLQIQVTGNIKKEDHVYVWLDAGADHIILSSQATKNKGLVEELCIEFPNKIFVAMDLKSDSNESNPEVFGPLIERAKYFEDSGVAGMVFTHVPSNGKANASSLKIANKLAGKVDVPVIANGGLYTNEDLKIIDDLKPKKLFAVIIGKPIYENTITYKYASQKFATI